ncbi:MAG: hypothetical protein PHV34_24320 [Verrucomicrobiae bacterium]|nr:hypothetical protein [Verrucomicrobiae bacterium]
MQTFEITSSIIMPGRLILCLCFALAGRAEQESQTPSNPPSPEAVYYIPSSGNGMSLPELESCGINAISHVPYEKDFIKAARQAGVRILPYVSLYKASNSKDDPTCMRHPFWKEVDAAAHPEWLLIDENGKVKRPFDAPNYCAGLEQSCCNHQALQDAYVKAVENVMQAGCGGIFIDNIHPTILCHGEKLGIHRHDWPDQNNSACFEKALKRVYETVKRHGSDKLCVINPSIGDPRWAEFGDYVMLECFIYKDQRKGDLNRRSYRHNPFWLDFPREYCSYSVFQRKGSLVAQSYFADPCSADESVFFSFACSKLLGPRIWAATSSMWESDWSDRFGRRDMERRIYRAQDMGKPLANPVIKTEYGLRQFEQASLIVNPLETTQTLEAPVEQLQPPLAELFTGQEVAVKAGKATLTLPPESARLVLNKTRVLENFLREIRGELRASRLYMEADLDRRGKLSRFDQDTISALSQVEKKTGQMLDKIENATPEALARLTNETAVFNEARLKNTADSICKNANTLDASGLETLLAAPNAGLPDIEIYDGGRIKKLILRSAGAAYIFPAYVPAKSADPYLPSAMLVFGEDAYADSIAGPIARTGASGEERIRHRYKKRAKLEARPTPEMGVKDRWVVPGDFRSLKTLENAADCKKAAGEMTLMGRDSRQLVKGMHLALTAEVRQGSPWLRLSATVVRDDGGVCPTDLQLIVDNSQCQTNPQTGASPQSQKSSLSLPWIFLHSNPKSRSGALLKASPLVFEKGAAKGKSGTLNVSLAPVGGKDFYFLAERFRNIRIYAGLALQLVENLALKVNAPDQAPLDGVIQAEVCLESLQKQKLDSVSYEISAETAACGQDQTLPVECALNQAKSSDGRRVYDCSLKGGSKMNDILAVTAVAHVKFKDGRMARLEQIKLSRLKKPLTMSHVQSGPVETMGSRATLVIKNISPLRVKGQCGIEMVGKCQVKPAKIDFEAAGLQNTPLNFGIIPATPSTNRTVDGKFWMTTGDGAKTEENCKIYFAPTIEARHWEGRRLEQPGWFDEMKQQSTGVAGFVHSKTGVSATPQTEVCAAHGTESLLVGIRCFEPDMAGRPAYAMPDSKGYSPATLLDDCVELYLRPDVTSGEYCRIGINSKGAWKSDQINYWKGKVEDHAGYWDVKLEIPYSSLKAKPRPGDVWGVNFCRNRRGVPSSWAMTHGSWGQPNAFGWINFK